MARLSFRFTPLETVDFDVCAGPPRPEPAPPERETKATEPAREKAPAAVEG